MVLEKVPSFQEVKDWAASKTELNNHINDTNNPHNVNTDSPVDDVNGQTGSVSISQTQSTGKAGGIAETVTATGINVTNDSVETFNFKLNGQVSDETILKIYKASDVPLTLTNIWIYTDTGSTTVLNKNLNVSIPHYEQDIEVSELHPTYPISDVTLEFTNDSLNIGSNVTTTVKNRIPTVASHSHQI